GIDEKAARMAAAEKIAAGHLETDGARRLMTAPPAQRVLQRIIHRIARRPVVPRARRRPADAPRRNVARRDRQPWSRRGARGGAVPGVAAVFRNERALDDLVDQRR